MAEFDEPEKPMTEETETRGAISRQSAISVGVLISMIVGAVWLSDRISGIKVDLLPRMSVMESQQATMQAQQNTILEGIRDLQARANGFVTEERVKEMLDDALAPMNARVTALEKR